MATRAMDGSDRAGAKSRALVVINEAVAGAELRDGLIRQLGERIDEVFVVVPAIPDSGIKYMLGDVDGAIKPAEERLRRTLEELRGAGIAAEGEVGDSDPLQAIQDELLKLNPDQIIVVAHGDADSAFAEKGLLEQAERDLDMPITELVVDKAAEPHLVDVEHTQTGAGRKRGWRLSGNWPPLTRHHMFGIAVAVIGTLLLGVLATEAVGDATGHDLEEGRLDAAAAATVLIATGMALLNLAHVVGLFLFQSVGYDGMWSRFLARISLFGTPIAVLAAVILASV